MSPKEIKEIKDTQKPWKKNGKKGKKECLNIKTKFLVYIKRFLIMPHFTSKKHFIKYIQY